MQRTYLMNTTSNRASARSGGGRGEGESVVSAGVGRGGGGEGESGVNGGGSRSWYVLYPIIESYFANWFNLTYDDLLFQLLQKKLDLRMLSSAFSSSPSSSSLTASTTSSYYNNNYSRNNDGSNPILLLDAISNHDESTVFMIMALCNCWIEQGIITKKRRMEMIDEWKVLSCELIRPRKKRPHRPRASSSTTEQNNDPQPANILQIFLDDSKILITDDDDEQQRTQKRMEYIEWVIALAIQYHSTSVFCHFFMLDPHLNNNYQEQYAQKRRKMKLLCCAVNCGARGIVRYLLYHDYRLLGEKQEEQKDSNENGGSDDNSNGNRNCGTTVLHLAVKLKKYGTVQDILEIASPATKRVVNAVDTRGQTPLHIAVNMSTDNLPIVQFLLQKGADVRVQDKSGSSVLHYAAAKGQLQVLKYLLQDGAGSTCLNVSDSLGRTPLHYAARCGKAVIVKELLFADLMSDHHQTSNTTTTTGRGGAGGHDVARLGEDDNYHGYASLCTMKDKRGKTPFHHACEFGFLRIVQTLMRYCHSDGNVDSIINDVDENGISPLRYAIRFGNVELVENLLKHLGFDDMYYADDNYTLIAEIEQGLVDRYIPEQQQQEQLDEMLEVLRKYKVLPSSSSPSLPSTSDDKNGGRHSSATAPSTMIESLSSPSRPLLPSQSASRSRQRRLSNCGIIAKTIKKITKRSSVVWRSCCTRSGGGGGGDDTTNGGGRGRRGGRRTHSSTGACIFESFD